MKKMFIMGVAILGLTACGVDHSKATRTLSSMGYTDIKIGGYALWGCGDNDSFRSKFTAIGQDGQPVSGVVCSALFKGYTVRFD